MGRRTLENAILSVYAYEKKKRIESIHPSVRRLVAPAASLGRGRRPSLDGWTDGSREAVDASRTYREGDGDVGGGRREPLPGANVENPLDELPAVRRVVRPRDVEDEATEKLALAGEHLCARARVELGTVRGGVAGARRAQSRERGRRTRGKILNRFSRSRRIARARVVRRRNRRGRSEAIVVQTARGENVAVAPVAVFGGEGVGARARVVDAVAVDGFRSFDFMRVARRHRDAASVERRDRQHG